MNGHMSVAVAMQFRPPLPRNAKAGPSSDHSAINCPVGLPRYPHHRFISRRNQTGSSVQSVRNTRNCQRLYAAASDDAAGMSPSDDALPDTPPAEDTSSPPGSTGASDAGQAESGSQSSGPSTSASSAGEAAAAPLSSAEEAAAVVALCVGLIQERRLDELLTYIPDEVIDRCLQRRKQRALRGSAAADASITFEDVLRQASKRDFYLDTFAMRALVFEPPRSIQVLSSMAFDDSSFQQRCAVVASSGEISTITFRMRRVETLEPQFKGLLLVKRWVIASITGESDTEEGLEGGGDGVVAPHPRLSPEAMVLAQLSALQRLDYGTVFSFASPSNQAATGPVRRFASMLQSPSYEPLLGHKEAIIMSTMQAVPRSAVVVVSIKPAEDGNWRGSGSGTGGGQLAYLWFLTLQGPGPLEGCWMTDAVQLGAPGLEPPGSSG